MTITIHNADGSLVDINDTLGILLSTGPDPEPEVTRRLVPPHRRPQAKPTRFEDRRSFAGVGSTGEHPIAVAKTRADAAPFGVVEDTLTADEPLDTPTPVDAEQERFNRFYSATQPVGRHRSRHGRRTWRAVLVAYVRRTFGGAQ